MTTPAGSSPESPDPERDEERPYAAPPAGDGPARPAYGSGGAPGGVSPRIDSPASDATAPIRITGTGTPAGSAEDRAAAAPAPGTPGGPAAAPRPFGGPAGGSTASPPTAPTPPAAPTGAPGYPGRPAGAGGFGSAGAPATPPPTAPATGSALPRPAAPTSGSGPTIGTAATAAGAATAGGAARPVPPAAGSAGADTVRMPPVSGAGTSATTGATAAAGATAGAATGAAASGGTLLGSMTGTDTPRAGAATAAGNPAAAQPLRATGKPRRARLVVRRVDPWSVLKFSLLFSICLLIVFVVAVAALYYALDSLGVFESVNRFVRDITQAGTENGRATGGFDVVISPGKVIGGAAVIGAINVVIVTAISTLGAFLYNLCSDIVGGIEVTLAERD